MCMWAENKFGLELKMDLSVRSSPAGRINSGLTYGTVGTVKYLKLFEFFGFCAENKSKRK